MEKMRRRQVEGLKGIKGKSSGRKRKEKSSSWRPKYGETAGAKGNE
jgi:hypothetical protein